MGETRVSERERHEAPELVSVVVPTRDTARTIERCLASIRAQTHPAIELIVVDNWSQDGTWETARRLADAAVQAGTERAAQRNLGIERAGGEWVLWIDADMELPPEVVERALAAAHTAGAVGVFIPEATTGSGFWTACRALERRCYHGEPRIEAPRLLRTSELRDLGGFDEHLAGTEDAELRTRLLARGAPLAWADTLILHHEGRLTLTGVARKRFYYGKGIPAYRHAHPGAVSGQLGATLAAFWRHRRLLAADPPHAAGVIVLRTWEAAAYAAGAAAGASARGKLARP
ncbi:MAG TPA: glycosyltransferase [Actinomycetota bacterium]